MGNGPRGFSQPERKRGAHSVSVVVVSCEPELGQACVRSEEGVRYVVDSNTDGIELSSLREGNALDCQIADDGFMVKSACRVERAY